MKFVYLHLILIFFTSCSSEQKINPYRPVETLPSWFKTSENFALREEDGSYTVHPFFDSKHHLDEKNFGVNFILVTPEESDFLYMLDLVSGGLVADKKYCEQEDVWQRNSNKLERPPFSYGVIPRWIDSLGSPQEILVFGRGGYYRGLDKKFTKTHRSRIVGGVNLQYCPKKLCRANDWISNIIPVAVDPKDSSFIDVNTIDDLKSEVDWSDVILFLQNGKGRVLRARKDIPSYRLLSEISAKSTIKYLKSKSYEFKFKKMVKMRDACHALYGSIWRSSKKLRNIVTKSDTQIINEFRKKLFDRNVYKKEKTIVSEDKVLGIKNNKNFARWFEEFFEKNGKDFKTCARYTRTGNFSVDREQFWFFVYFDLFFKMQDVGFVYNCNSNAWIKNYRNAGGDWGYSQSDFLKECSVSSLDKAFETASNYMLDLQKNNLDHFRFIRFDRSLGGSHQKIYSWVNFSGKNFRCLNDSENNENKQMISRSITDELTPWRKFSKKRNRLYELIY